MAKRKRKGGGAGGLLGTLLLLLLLFLQWLTGEDFGVEIVTTLPTATPQATYTAQSTLKPTKAPTKAPTQTPDAQDSEGMTLHVLEVGKADCLLLECEGEWMLVDGGNEEDEEYILGKLSEMGVDKLSVLVNTHPHEDHLGSLDAVIYAVEVEQAYLSPRDHTTRNYERLLTALADREVPTKMAEKGEKWQIGGAQVTVLSPEADADYDGYNDWSLVMMVQYGDVRYLLMGDAETPVEGDLVDSGVNLDADVLKVGHHGSSTSSRKNFLAAVSPEYALIPCDGTEEAGAPHEKVVRYLQEYGIPFLRTDENGVISVFTDGKDLALSTERETVIR